MSRDFWSHFSMHFQVGRDCLGLGGKDSGFGVSNHPSPRLEERGHRIHAQPNQLGGSELGSRLLASLADGHEVVDGRVWYLRTLRHLHP